MLSLIDVDAALSEDAQDFWKDVLARCTKRLAEVLEGTETSYPETVEASVRQDGMTRFCCDLEITLCGGYSQEEYAEDFRKAMHLLTNDAVPNFKVSLNAYYLGHDADLSVEYDRQELAA